MQTHMKAVASQPIELSVEERNLLSVAYKNVIGSRRASWRVLSSIESKGEPDKLQLISYYKKKIEQELVDICDEILKIISNELVPRSTSMEGKVFYYKMKGDYWRYLAEFATGAGRKEAAEHSRCRRGGTARRWLGLYSQFPSASLSREQWLRDAARKHRLRRARFAQADLLRSRRWRRQHGR